MNENLAQLRLDVRMRRRRGWISQEELARELESLPDASEKIAPVERPASDATGEGGGADK